MDGWLVWALWFIPTVLVLLAADRIYRRHRWLLRSIAPSAAVLLLGAGILFATQQGRDLGSALLVADRWQVAWFLAGLLFWALATWHNARFPLDRAHERWVAADPSGRRQGVGEWWRNWTPRLMGGLVFVFALIHVVLAWWKAAETATAIALALLILAAAVVYGLFVVLRRDAGRAVRNRLAPSLAQTLDRAFADKHAAAADDHLTVAPALSTWTAFAFYFAVAIFATYWAWQDPLDLGRRLGSMAVGFLAFGGFLTGLVALWMVAERLRRPLPVMVGMLLVLALAVSLGRHYHPVRSCAGLPGCLEGAALADARPDLSTAALAWYSQARELVPDGEPVPMVIVAAAGGGLRAAYWTAVVLGRLPEDIGLDLGRFQRHLFAISGVSGGSVGAAFRAALQSRHDDAAALDRAVRAALSEDYLAATLASLAFVDVPSWILPKLDQPTRGVVFERAMEAEAPELAEPFSSFAPRFATDASAEADLSGEAAAEAAWRPLLFLNSTHQETGRRVIASHVRIDRDPFLDSFDLHELLDIDVRLSTAAHNSARFSYVSPAGRLAEHGSDADRGWIIDGGYFENFAALTAEQLVRGALAAIAEATGRDDAVRPVIIQISSDPSIGGDPEAPAGDRDRAGLGELAACAGAPSEPLPYVPDKDGQGYLAGNQLLAPLRGVLGSRVAHGVAASKDLARFACDRQAAGLPVAYAHFAMCELVDPPLGWVMSEASRQAIEALVGLCANERARSAVRQGFAIEDAATN